MLSVECKRSFFTLSKGNVAQTPLKPGFFFFTHVSWLVLRLFFLHQHMQILNYLYNDLHMMVFHFLLY